MIPGAVRVALLAVLSLGAFVTGVGQALLGTGVGRETLLFGLASVASRSLRGSISVDSVGGSVLDGLVARGIRLVGTDGRPLLAVGRLNVRYTLRDVLSGRVVLGNLALDSVRVMLERRPGERFNYEDVLRLGEGSGGGRPLLVAFRDVHIRDLLVTVRTPDGSDSGFAERYVRVANAVLPYARVSSPLPNERGIHLEIATLDAALSEPVLRVLDARGTLAILGDTIGVDVAAARLPGTETSMRGRFYALGRGPLVDLAFDARRLASGDLIALFDWLPVGVTGSGELVARHASDDVLEVRGRDLDLAMADGGAVRGRIGLTLGPGERWNAHGVDLLTRDFDLADLHGLLDTVPMAGRLTGRTRADGPRDAVRVDLDWVFHDARADSAETLLRGGGTVGFGGPEGLAFAGVRLDTARVALATVRAISPAVRLRGDVEGKGTLDGPLVNATFTGTLAHRHADLPVSWASGRVRLDTRPDTVGVWGELAFDSLAWDAMRADYAAVPFAGAMAGTLTLAGHADALDVRASLSGTRGGLAGGGTFTAVAQHLAVRDLDVEFGRLELEALTHRLPDTRLTGRMTGVADFDTLRPPILDLDVALGTSVVGGSLVDELSGRVRMADGTLVVDSARGRAIGTLLVGHGRLPVTGEGGDSLVFTLTADDLAAVGALTRELAGLGSDTLGGQAAGRVVVTGSLERPQVAWRMASRRIGWNGLVIHGARAEGRWRTGDTALAAQFEVDSVRSGERSYRRLLAAAAGRGKAFRWIASGEIGPWAGFRAGGAFARGDSVALRFDSLALFAAGDEWRLPSGARLVATKEALALENLRLATTDGARLVAFDGALPRGGAGTLTGTVEALAVRDLWALFQYNPQSAAGELSGTFTVSGSGSAPLIQASFELRDAVFNEYRSPLINGTLHYGDRRLTGELNTFRVGTQIVSVDLSLPVDLAFRPLARRRLPGPLVVRAHAEQVDLSLLSAVSPLVRETEGLMSLDLGLEGTWDAPELDGWLEIENGAVTFPAIGVRHRELRGRVSLSGDSIRVDSLSARSGTGAASVAGVVRLEGLSRPVLDLRVRARDFRALDVPGFLTLVTSGEVRLQGPVFGATLTGAGTIPRGVIYFADIVQKEVVSLSDTLLAMDSATARLVREAHLGPNFENRFLDGLRVENLELTMGGDVHLRSTEADIFLTGRVLVQKQADRYRLDGTLETPRGTYQLDVGPTIRKQFTVTRGEVRYFGTPDLNATLDIDARHQLRGQGGENVAVFVHVGGTLLAPELRLTSDVQPPLTNEEIISYLVIGAPNVQAGQGVVGYGARESFSTLTAQISGQLSSRLMADLGVPLDYLEIRPQLGVQGVERTAVDIVAGRQIGDRWFLRLNPRICSRQAISAENIGGSIEFRIARDWGLLASADPVEVCRITTAGRLQLGLDVLWELRF